MVCIGGLLYLGYVAIFVADYPEPEPSSFSLTIEGVDVAEAIVTIMTLLSTGQAWIGLGIAVVGGIGLMHSHK